MANGLVLGLLSRFLRHKAKYDKIRNDEQAKAAAVSFGVSAIVNSIVCASLFTLGVFGLTALLGALDSESLGVLVIVPLAILLAIVEIVLFAQYIFGGLIGVVYQLKCNRRPIGWVALGLFIAATIGMIVGSILILTKLPAF